MNLIADILLVAGALGAGVYCFVLARRLARFNDLESGVGGAVAVLSAQVDDLTRTLQSAQKTAGNSTLKLETLTGRAEDVAKRLELMLASMHDLPAAEAPNPDVTESPTTEAPEIELDDTPDTEAKEKRRAKQKAKRKRKPGAKQKPEAKVKKNTDSQADRQDARAEPDSSPMFKRRQTKQEQAA